ncbi:MAG: hypothetical protein ABEJ72_10680, partial [Candidatus Aenigmatarchaeota archaeon]
MMFFQVFLPAFAFCIAIVSIVMVYLSLEDVKDSHMPSAYLNIFALSGLAIYSAARIYSVLAGEALLDFPLLKDLMIAYIGLFLFGA